MDTPWTSLVSATNPLPEYPRPQLTRPEWLNLNGPWQFDKAEVQGSGDPLSAPPIGRDLPQTVLVPFPIESNLSGVRAIHERWMWYRCTLQIPESWQGRQVQHNFGAANWRTVVWVNGHFVGTHTGAYDAFSFNITPYLGPRS
jgi:beta-galactosidase/beta-glucuronidase